MINYLLDGCDFTKVIQDEDEEKWLQARTTGIGGSDAGAILGLNKYSSPLTIYMAKKGAEGFKGNAATKWGHILEDPIRKMTAEELGIEICTVPGMYTSKDYDFMNANIDGICNIENPVTIGNETVSGIGGLEIKTSTKGDGFTEDEIPDSYYCQVQHYMAVTNFNWFILTVFFLNTKVGKYYVIRRNDDFIYNRLIPAEKNFWQNNVLANNPPEPIGVDSENEYLKSLPIDSVVTLDAESEQLIKDELFLDQQIKVLQEQQTQLKNKILIKLAENSTGFENADKTIATVGNYKVTYNTQIRKSVDTDAIKKAGLFDQFCKETSSRILRISVTK